MPSDSTVAGALAAATFPAGSVVHVSANRKVALAQADIAAHVSGAVGIALGENFVFSGKAGVLLEAGLLPLPGDTLYVSATQAGRATNVAPVLPVPFATIYDTSGYGSVSNQVQALISGVDAGSTVYYIDDLIDGPNRSAFREQLPLADPFPTSIVWWTDATKTLKIVELLIVRNANQTPATMQWKVYAVDGVTVIRTVTDTIAYSGVFETTRTRIVV